MRTFLVGLISFGLGVGVTHWWIGSDDPSGRSSPARGDVDADFAVVVAVRAENERLEAELARVRAERPEATPETDAPEGTVANAEQSAGHAAGRFFVDPKHEKALRAVDWKPIGEAFHQLMPLLTEANELANGRIELRPEFYGEIMKSLGPMINLDVTLDKADISWSSPSVLLNLVDATLTSAGQPINEQQIEPLRELGIRSADRYNARRDGYSALVPAVRRRYDESILHGELCNAVRPLLTDEQRAVLWPSGVPGVVGLDVFSAASTWDEHLEHLPHVGRETLRTNTAAALVRLMGLRAELKPMLLHWVTEWETAFSDAYLLAKPTGAAAKDLDYESTARVLAAAEAQVKLFETIIAQLPLNDEERRKLIELDVVYVPIYRGEG